ncbi:MAG: SDR family oxidoreductase [Pseudomonadota bacterium]
MITPGAILEGKTALITGSARRLGRATALALAGAGADIVVHYRGSAAEAERVVEEIGGVGRKAWAIGADLAVRREAEGLIERAAQAAGPLTILVNSASVFPPGGLDTITMDDLQKNIELNAWAPLLLGRKFAAQTETGHIVNFLDTKVAGYDWGHAAYHASKVMLELFTRMMAIRFAPGIAVNAVAPGLILPPAGKDGQYLEGLKDSTLLKRAGDPKQVADAVLFLVTSEYITGQVIFVDGGRHLKGGDLG